MACVLSHFSHVQLFATLWTAASQAPLSMGFSKQEYWSGLPCPPPWALPNSGIEPIPLISPVQAGRSLPLVTPEKPNELINWFLLINKSSGIFTFGLLLLLLYDSIHVKFQGKQY